MKNNDKIFFKKWYMTIFYGYSHLVIKAATNKSLLLMVNINNHWSITPTSGRSISAVIVSQGQAVVATLLARWNCQVTKLVFDGNKFPSFSLKFSPQHWKIEFNLKNGYSDNFSCWNLY